MKQTPDNTSLASELFMELASETRLSILSSLNERPAKLSSLSREVNTTVQDVYRNLNRMVQEGLIRRSEGMFYVTEYGMSVMRQIPHFMFIKKHRRYFENHRLDSVFPSKFLQRIGALNNCKTVNSATAVFQSLKKMQSSATKSLKIIVSQAWPEEGEIFIDRANHGVKIFSIIGQNTIFPKNVIENIIPKLESLASKGNLERRMIEKVKVAAFIVDDHEAALTFSNAEDEVDMTTLFVGQDSDFCEWCLDYFDYVWKDSKAFDINKVKVVEY